MKKPETCPVCQREIGRNQSRRALILLALAGIGIGLILSIVAKAADRFLF